MGFLSEIKKLIFAQKSVAKSAVNKSTEFASEKKDEFVDISKDMLKSATEDFKDKTSGLREAVMEKSSDFAGSIKETAGEKFDQLKDKAGEIIDDISDNEYVKKTAKFTEKVGDAVLQAGEKTMDKVEDISEDFGEKFSDVKEDIIEKAKDLSEKISEKLDETLIKAKDLEAEEAAKPEFAEKPIDLSKPLLDDEDDFFSKASKYADGDYGSFSEGRTTFIETKDQVEEIVDSVESKGKAAGFEDLDGDGNEIMDDAIIISDQEE